MWEKCFNNHSFLDGRCYLCLPGYMLFPPSPSLGLLPVSQLHVSGPGSRHLLVPLPPSHVLVPLLLSHVLLSSPPSCVLLPPQLRGGTRVHNRGTGIRACDWEAEPLARSWEIGLRAQGWETGEEHVAGRQQNNMRLGGVMLAWLMIKHFGKNWIILEVFLPIAYWIYKNHLIKSG